jgi:hypothetical protein
MGNPCCHEVFGLLWFGLVVGCVWIWRHSAGSAIHVLIIDILFRLGREEGED